MKIIFVGLVFILMFSLPMEAGEPAGKAVYDKSCKSCHGPNGEGNPNIAKMMKVEMRHLGSKEVQAKSDADLKNDVTKGTGKMKAITRLSGEEVDKVVAFLRTLAKK